MTTTLGSDREEGQDDFLGREPRNSFMPVPSQLCCPFPHPARARVWESNHPIPIWDLISGRSLVVVRTIQQEYCYYRYDDDVVIVAIIFPDGSHKPVVST
jgi:hypothetical protein